MRGRATGPAPSVTKGLVQLAEDHVLAISDHAAYTLHVLNERKVFSPKGDVTEERGPVTIYFQRGGAPEWAKQIAFEKLQFNGVPDGYPKEFGMGVFDSKTERERYGWNDEEYAAVLARLRQYDGTGDYVIVEQPRLSAPWASYDELVVQGQRTAEKVAERNLETARATGTPVADLIAYEQQNRSDERIIAVYRAALEAEPAAAADELVEA